METRTMDFAAAWQELRQIETANNGLKSEEFYAAYTKGEIDPSPSAMRWATVWEIFLELAPPVETTVDSPDRRLVSA